MLVSKVGGLRRTAAHLHTIVTLLWLPSAHLHGEPGGAAVQVLAELVLQRGDVSTHRCGGVTELAHLQLHLCLQAMVALLRRALVHT